MQNFWQDLRYGARMLWKNPGFALIAVITLALGIGANTSIFSVVNAVLLQALPYRDSDRLVMVWEHNRPRNRPMNVVNAGNYSDWRAQNGVFEDMAAFADTRSVLTGEGEPEEVGTQLATPNLFSVLGVNAIIGRTFTPDDGKPNQPRAVMLGYGFWQRRFGGDPEVIGRKILLNRNEAIIVGVLPPDFRWFIKQGSLTGNASEIWTAFALTNEMLQRQGRFLSVVARLKPGVTSERAQVEMSDIGARLESQYKEFNTGWGVNVVPLRRQLTGEIRLALLVLLAAVAFVVLIACANVANLLLARAAVRQREIAVRSALGAGRARVVRQLFTESLLLALLGGAAGLLLAWVGTKALVSLSPPDLVNLQGVKVSAPVLLFTLGVSLLTGVVFGLAPAFETSRLNLSDALKEGKGVIGGARARGMRNAFVVAEVALALVLLVGAGLMMRSFAHLQGVDPGFDARKVLTMRVALPGAKYRQDQQRIDFFKRAVEKLRALPGVESAGAISFLPFAAPPAGTGFDIEGQPKQPAGQGHVTRVAVTDAHYFEAMRIPLRRGRLFTEQEATTMRHVVVINEALARRYFTGEDPLGKRLTIDMKDENLPCEVIGVVGDVKHEALDAPAEPMSYWPHPELVYSNMTLVVRTRGAGNTENLAAPAREVIHSLDAEQPVADVRTMEGWLGRSLSRSRFSTLLLAVFAGVAALLAGVGIYGVMSYSVAQRTHEVGIRLALGARGRDVLRLVVGQGMKLASIGLALGLAVAVALTRLMEKLLFGVSPTDPLTFIVVALMIIVVALLACWLPARRAARVDPMIALRYE
jgi:putative ABC transport system permease protein